MLWGGTGNGAQRFYDANGAEPLFTFGGLPGVAGPDAPAFSYLQDTPKNRAMTKQFQAWYLLRSK
jgi:hypothetical protein